LIGLCRNEEALDSFDEAISRSPNFADAHVAKVEAVALAEATRNQPEDTEGIQDNIELTNELEQSILDTLAIHPEKEDLIDKTLVANLSSRRLKTDDETPVELPSNAIRTDSEVRAKLLKLEDELFVVKNIVQQHGIKIEKLHQTVDKLSENLRGIRVTADRALAMCLGADEESKATRQQIENVQGHINRMEHLEAIQTELESLIVVATAVNSGMIDWDAEMPEAVGIACLATNLIALVPIPGDASKLIAQGLQVSLKFGPKMKQRLQFEEIAESVSTLKLNESLGFHKLLLLLSLKWSMKHEDAIKQLPKWNSELGQEFRQELLNTWNAVCGSIKGAIKGGTRSFLERVRDGCSRLMKAVGLKGAEYLSKKSKLPKETKRLKFGSKVHSKVCELRAKGSLMLFGGENVNLITISRRLVGGRPLSPATVLGKVHAREILQLLIETDVKEALQTVSRRASSEEEKSWESAACDAMMKIYESGELKAKAKIPRADANSTFMFF